MRRPGCRFSVVDACAIACCAGATWFLRDQPAPIDWLFAVVLGHFFLFCNIIRLRRSYELIWAAAFVIHVIWALCSEAPFYWAQLLARQSVLTAALCGIELASDRYHGIGWAWINPSLSGWGGPIESER